MAHLYAGSILFVDLSQGTISREPTSSYAGDFLGGRGINSKLIYDNVPPGVDPLDPANVITFGVGPLGGTAVATGRTDVSAKSPESGLLGMSNFGGYWGSELKYAGYDNIAITGKADKPVYIWIDNDQVEIKDASSIWGKDAYETQDLIRRELENPEVKVLCIGPAGENLVRFASIQSGLGHGAGRTGMGTVMGSKNLKAIAVRGTKGLSIADPKRYLALVEQVEGILRANRGAQQMAQYGVSAQQDQLSRVWFDPAKGEQPSQHAIFTTFKPKRAGCMGCPVQCMDHYQVEGVGSGVISCELYVVFVNAVRCYDPAVSLECALLSQRYGIDCISAGVTIAWLMNLYEKGIITAKDTDGIAMEWGSPEAIRGMLEKMTYRQGFGDVLADGLLSAAERIGRGSEKYANQVPGRIPMVEEWDPETLPSFKGEALASAVGPRGDVMRSRPSSIEMTDAAALLEPDPRVAEDMIVSIRERAKRMFGTEKAAIRKEYEGKPEAVVYFEDVPILCDSLSTCKYLSPWLGMPFSPRHQAALLSAGSGVETSVDELYETARRIRTLERAYEIREGWTRDMDSLPRQFMDRPIEQGRFKGEVLESEKFEGMKSRYYALRGWDPDTGVPTEQTLEELGLDDVARDLERIGRLPARAAKGQGNTKQ